MQPAHPARASCQGKPRARRQVGASSHRKGAHRGDALILGAIIAGGAASRFGSDKALALLAGKPLIDHAADALAPHVDATVLCGRTREGWTCLPDRPRHGLGPLGGIAAALAYAQANGFASVLTIACDMPDVPEQLLTALAAILPSYCADAPILGHWPAREAHNLLRHAGLVPASADPPAHRALVGRPRDEPGVTKNPHLSIRRWAQSIDASAIPAPRPLANINTPADLVTP